MGYVALNPVSYGALILHLRGLSLPRKAILANPNLCLLHRYRWCPRSVLSHLSLLHTVSTFVLHLILMLNLGCSSGHRVVTFFLGLFMFTAVRQVTLNSPYTDLVYQLAGGISVAIILIFFATYADRDKAIITTT